MFLYNYIDSNKLLYELIGGNLQLKVQCLISFPFRISIEIGLMNLHIVEIQGVGKYFNKW